MMQSQSLKPLWDPPPYQVEGVRIQISQGSAGLLLDPGLGKTSISLMSMKVLLGKEYARKILVVAPLQPVFSTWPAEINKWADFENLTWTILHDDHGKGKVANLKLDVQIYLINPAGLKWLLAQPDRPKFDILCVDESTDFKDTRTQRFKLMKQLLQECRYRWILTGTIIPNGLEDLFGQIYILDQGSALGRYITHYRMQYFDVDYTGYKYTPKPAAFDQIVAKVKPLVLRLSALDHLKMPELMRVTLPVQLPSAVMRQYKQVEDQFFLAVDEHKIVAGNKAVAGGKCRQIANGAVYTTTDAFEQLDKDGEYVSTPPDYVVLHEEKLERLSRLVAELSGAPLLVAYEFKHDRDQILSRFPDAGVIGAGVSRAKRQAYIDAFNAGKLKILLGQPASMSRGLNLQGACRHVALFGITWNLEHHDQFIARVYRQGQKHDTVYVYYIVAEQTMDEKVCRVLQAKDRDQQSFLSQLGRKDDA